MQIFKVLKEIDYLASIDWSQEEYKPYDIMEDMTPKQIEKHLLENHVQDIKNDLNIN